MPRSDFEIWIPGTCNTSRWNGSEPNSFEVSNARTALEQSSGTSRHKPTGWIPPTGYSFFRRSYNLARGTKEFHIPDFPQYGSRSSGVVQTSANEFDQCLLESAIEDTSLANQALIRARIGLKRTDINLGVAFGERNQTARLVGDTASRLARSFRQLRRGETRGAMRTLGISSQKNQPRGSNVPKKWLELQYGWKPLLSDVYGACRALSRNDIRDWRVTSKARLFSRNVKVKSDYERSSTGTCVARYSTGAFVRIDALPTNDVAQSLSSLGVTNPLLVAWELVPFSFVVDWFSPVGSWLESLDALLGYSSVYTSTSVISRCTWIYTGGHSTDPDHPDWTYDNNFTGDKQYVKLVRSVESGAPLPTFPRVKDPLSLGHMANGLALLSQAFGR